MDASEEEQGSIGSFPDKTRVGKTDPWEQKLPLCVSSGLSHKRSLGGSVCVPAAAHAAYSPSASRERGEEDMENLGNVCARRLAPSFHDFQSVCCTLIALMFRERGEVRGNLPPYT